MKTITLDDYIDKNLKKPGFRKAWEASEVRYQLVRQLIKERITKKISQRKLAKMADTTQAVISRVENLSVNPSIDLVERIAFALGKRLELKLS